MIRLLSPILSLYFGTFRKFKPIEPDTVKRIAILPAGGIGDAITILPMIRYLRRICPQAEIHIITYERNSIVFFNDPDIHTVHIPRSAEDWLKYKVYDFSIVFILNWINISGWGIRALKVGGRNSVRVIPFQGNKYNYLFSFQSKNAAKVQNVSDCYIDLVADTFGKTIADEERKKIPYELTLSSEALQYAHNIFPSDNYPYAVINFSVIHAHKQWHTEGYRTIAQEILNAHPDFRIVLLFMENDTQAVHECFGELFSDRIIYAPPTDNFLNSAALIRNACFLFSVDTSFVHCCSAFGIPAFVLYIGEKNNATLWSPRNVTYGYVESKNGNAISTITGDEVLQHFREFLTLLKT